MSFNKLDKIGVWIMFKIIKKATKKVKSIQKITPDKKMFLQVVTCF